MTPVTIYAPCSACGGRGRESHHADGYLADVCPNCQGLGSVLTEDGKAIVGLLRAAGAEGMLAGE